MEKKEKHLSFLFCNICGKEEKNEKNMKFHLEKKHKIFVSEKYIKNSNGEVRYKCKICNLDIFFH